MTRTILTATAVALGCSLFAGAAAAQSVPSLPNLPTLPLPSLPTAPDPSAAVTIGTCEGGLVSVTTNGTTACVVPAVSSATGASSCAASLVGVTLPGGGSTVCVLPSQIALPVGGACAGGTIPVTVAGAGLECIVSTIVGAAGANGLGGLPGTGGTSGGSSSGSGSAGTQGANGSVGANGTSTSTGAAGSSTIAGARKVYAPTLTLAKKLRGSRTGTVHSSTKRVVITVIGKRHGRVVRFTKQASLKLTGKSTAARPYSAKVKITVKTKGRISIRITSRGGAQIKTATFSRTVR